MSWAAQRDDGSLSRPLGLNRDIKNWSVKWRNYLSTSSTCPQTHSMDDSLSLIYGVLPREMSLGHAKEGKGLGDRLFSLFFLLADHTEPVKSCKSGFGFSHCEVISSRSCVCDGLYDNRLLNKPRGLTFLSSCSVHRCLRAVEATAWTNQLQPVVFHFKQKDRTKETHLFRLR